VAGYAGCRAGRTDLYALGGLLYEMLAGRTPFRAVNLEGWMFQHIQGVPEPLGLLRPDLAKEHSGLEAVLDVGTHTNYGRGSMHVCPTGTYMRGLHDGKNWLVCTGGVDLSPSSQNPSIFLDSNGATVGNDMHMCPQSSIMTGIHDERNDFACVHFIR
jgi:serine/threonine protein kinase